MAQVLVIGSSNTDMVINLPELPRPGQTITGGKFQVFGGGKGANQAIAARRAGAEVALIAAVGDDDFGRAATGTFDEEGIDTSGIQVLAEHPSGVATIFVSAAGENCIGVAPGANAALLPDVLAAQERKFADADVLLMQLETPLATIERATDLADRHGLRVVLNPAPAAALPDTLIARLFCITPNETEAEALTGIAVADTESAGAAAERLLDKGAANVIVTLGSKGALLCNGDERRLLPAPSVNVVDTTGAGDTLNGVFCARIAAGYQLQDALQVAIDAASISVQSPGAIASIPYLND